MEKDISKFSFFSKDFIQTALPVFLFVGIVLYFSYAEQDERNALLAKSTYEFSDYQIQNGLYVSYVLDANNENLAHAVLVLKDNREIKLLAFNKKFLKFQNGPISKISSNFKNQQKNHFFSEKEKAAQKEQF